MKSKQVKNDEIMTEKEQLLTLKTKVIKLRNSKSRYLLIPDGYFEEIKHKDETIEIKRKDDDEKIQIIYVFNKKKVKK